MQIVCNDLYEYVVKKNKERSISKDDYTSGGGVNGALERFTDQAIKRVLFERYHKEPNRELISKWKDVIAHLVARQEGGALTSTLLPLRALRSFAGSIGLSDKVDECLEKMSGDSIRLVRSATFEGSLHYSLGHDSLATSLFQWKETRARVLAERRRRRRLELACLAALGVILVGLGFGVYTHFDLKYAAVRTLIDTAEHDDAQSVRKRLLLLAFGLKNTNSVVDRILARYFLSVDELPTKLKEAVLRSPIYIDTAEAAGLNGGKSKIAVLKPTGLGVVSLSSVDRPQEYHVENHKSDLKFPFAASAGFITADDIPAVEFSKNIVIYPNGPEGILKTFPPSLDREHNAAAVEFAGGLLRFNFYDFRPRLHFTDLRYDLKSGMFSTVAEVNKEYDGLYPAYSDTSEKDVFFTPRDAKTELVVSSRDHDIVEEAIGLIDNSEGKAGMGDLGPFVRSVAFANRDVGIVLRESRELINIFRLEPADISKPVSVALPKIYQDVPPVRQPWRNARPLLAATLLSDGKTWRIVWLEKSGIVGIEATEGSDVSIPLPGPLLSSINRMEFGTKLSLSDDGSYLTLFAQPEPGVVQIRAWDLTTQRKDHILKLANDEIIAEACRIAAMESDSGGKKLNESEMGVWRPIGSGNPCGD